MSRKQQSGGFGTIQSLGGTYTGCQNDNDCANTVNQDSNGVFIPQQTTLFDGHWKQFLSQQTQSHDFGDSWNQFSNRAQMVFNSHRNILFNNAF